MASYCEEIRNIISGKDDSSTGKFLYRFYSKKETKEEDQKIEQDQIGAIKGYAVGLAALKGRRDDTVERRYISLQKSEFFDIDDLYKCPEVARGLLKTRMAYLIKNGKLNAAEAMLKKFLEKQGSDAFKPEMNITAFVEGIKKSGVDIEKLKKLKTFKRVIDEIVKFYLEEGLKPTEEEIDGNKFIVDLGVPQDFVEKLKILGLSDKEIIELILKRLKYPLFLPKAEKYIESFIKTLGEKEYLEIIKKIDLAYRRAAEILNAIYALRGDVGLEYYYTLNEELKADKVKAYIKNYYAILLKHNLPRFLDISKEKLSDPYKVSLEKISELKDAFTDLEKLIESRSLEYSGYFEELEVKDEDIERLKKKLTGPERYQEEILEKIKKLELLKEAPSYLKDILELRKLLRKIYEGDPYYIENFITRHPPKNDLQRDFYNTVLTIYYFHMAKHDEGAEIAKKLDATKFPFIESHVAGLIDILYYDSKTGKPYDKLLALYSNAKEEAFKYLYGTIIGLKYYYEGLEKKNVESLKNAFKFLKYNSVKLLENVDRFYEEDVYSYAKRLPIVARYLAIIGMIRGGQAYFLALKESKEEIQGKKLAKSLFLKAVQAALSENIKFFNHLITESKKEDPVLENLLKDALNESLEYIAFYSKEFDRALDVVKILEAMRYVEVPKLDPIGLYYYGLSVSRIGLVPEAIVALEKSLAEMDDTYKNKRALAKTELGIRYRLIGLFNIAYDYRKKRFLNLNST